MTRIAFPPVERPLVSVIVPVYGRWDWTSHALRALREGTGPCYEVIVVDDGSPDDAAVSLRAWVEGALLLANGRNLGFGPSVNRAALHARGRYLCILNSDAVVEPGWLEPMLARLEREAEAAAVVPMYLNLDGSVQEAGSVIGADGVTAPWGGGRDPSDPEVRFPRTVEYASAVCMLIRRAAFVGEGGFDPAFGLGYYEDVDLCLRLAARGLRVVYEPGSRVRHAGNASSGDRAPAMSAANRLRFVGRWGGSLEGRPPLRDLDGHRLVMARDHAAFARVLVVDEETPSPDSPLAGVLRALATGLPEGRVTFLRAEARAGPSVESLLERGVEVGNARDPAAWLADRAFHATVVVVRGPSTAARLGEAILAWQPHAAIVYDLVLSRDGGEESMTSLRAAEVQVLQRAEALLCPSPARAAFALALVPDVPTVLVDVSDPLPAWRRALAHAGVAVGGS